MKIRMSRSKQFRRPQTALSEQLLPADSGQLVHVPPAHTVACKQNAAPPLSGSSLFNDYAEFFDDPRSKNLLGKSLGNAKATTRDYLAHCGKTLNSPIGIEFGEAFFEGRDEYLRTLGLAPKSDSYRNKKYLLTKVHNVLTRVPTPSVKAVWLGEEPFHQTLNRALSGRTGSIKSVAKKIGIGQSTINDWKSGRKSPSRRSLDALGQLEKVLGIQTGMLTSSIFVGPSIHTLETGDSKFERHMQESGKKTNRYRCHHPDWPEQLHEEWERYYDYKTAPISRMEPSRHGSAGWDPSALRFTGTERVELNVFEPFFGFLVKIGVKMDGQPRKRRFRPNELSIALLADPLLVDAYLEWARTRAFGNMFNTHTFRVLGIMGALCRSKFGFLFNLSRQFSGHPHFRDKLPVKMQTENGKIRKIRTRDERWQAWCIQVELKSKEIAIEKRRTSGKSRDPLEALKPILLKPEPWKLLYTFLEKPIWESAMPNRKKTSLYAWEMAKRIFMSLLIRFGFRGQTFQKMLLKDFVATVTGYELTLPPPRFKNRSGLKSSYRASIEGRLAELIKEFIDELRPLLMAKNDPYFFPFGLVAPTAKRRPGKFVSRYSTVCKFFTQHYMGHLLKGGFMAHAVRYIIATDYIVRDPVNGPALAAIALWDDKDTVSRVYAYLDQLGMFKKHNDRIAELSEL